jgi:hypothetical protein
MTGDIVDRLMAFANCTANEEADLMNEAAEEIARMVTWLRSIALSTDDPAIRNMAKQALGEPV